MIPLQVIPFGNAPLLLGGLVFAVVLVGVVGYLFLVKYDRGEPWDDFAAATADIVDSEDADAIAFIPYSDGPLVPKPAIYDRELLGGKGGYRTPDGERIYVDGQGNGKFSLQGVDVVLAIDPTEHAAAADPLKAYIAHQNDLGRWIKVDREGEIVEAGDALASMDDVTPAMDMSKAQAEQAIADGGAAPSAVHETAIREGMDLADAKEELEEAGLLHKVVDLAPPRAVDIDAETGEIDVDEATHVAIDVSSAADLLPKKTNTTAWQTMEERARQEGMDWEERRKDIIMGVVIGGAIVGVAAVVLALVMGFM
jgi:hypothetical protein